MSAPLIEVEAGSLPRRVLKPEDSTSPRPPEKLWPAATEAPNPGRTEEPGGSEQLSPEQMQEAIERNGPMQFGGRTINFRYNEEAKRVVITVKDTESEEVIRQIPTEEYLDFVARFRELTGVLLDEQA